MSDYYTPTYDFTPYSKAKGEEIKYEFDAIAFAFSQIPSLSFLASGNPNYAEAGGTANALTVAMENTWTTYAGKDGYRITVKTTAANTDAVTIAVDGLAAVAIKRNDGTPIIAGDFEAGGYYDMTYDETAGYFRAQYVWRGDIEAGEVITVNGKGGNVQVLPADYGLTGDFVGTDDAQALTNKTISGASNTLSNISPSSLSTFIPASKGGTGVANNDAATLTRSGNHSLTITTAAPTTITLPSTGTLATLAGAETLSNKTLADMVLTGSVTEQVYTITDNDSVVLNPDNGTIQVWSMGANRTPTADIDAGKAMMLMVESSGTYSITWTSVSPTWVGGFAPSLSSAGYTVIVFWKVGTTIYARWVGEVV